MAITFRQGLTDQQRAGIESLAQKPQDKWTDTDRQNWSYATNNSPLPATQGDSAAPAAAAAPARQPWVDESYRKFFDRSATDEEMQQWQTQSPNALDSFLGAEQKKYGYTSQASKAEGQTNLQKAYAVIDSNPSLTPDQKALARQVVDSYQGGVEPDIPQILATFNQLKKTVIDPHYQDLIRQTEGELKGAATYNEKQRALEMEQEKLNEEARVKAAQQDLEGRGMTFSGQGVQQLGDKSAYAVQPFGGSQEGLINTQNRLVASTSSLRQQESIRQLGLQAEKSLGSQGVQGRLSGYSPLGGVTGSIPTARNQDYAQTLTHLGGNQEAKNDLNTGVRINLTQ